MVYLKIRSCVALKMMLQLRLKITKHKHVKCSGCL